MRRFLTFQLAGVMASWGEIALGEMRHTAKCPTRSGVFGIIAACLGIERNDGRLSELDRGFSFGGKTIIRRYELTDYHTAQVPPRQKNIVYRTRAEQIGGKSGQKLNTILSYRDYLTDFFSIVAIWERSPGAFSLDQIRESLRSPRFVPYLGRKSCPLIAPMLPELVEGASLKSALDGRDLSVFSDLAEGGGWIYHFEDLENSGIDNPHSRTIHDALTNRERWQFAPRSEYFVEGRDS
jgi:CRISPR system Cascade subunit CasD